VNKLISWLECWSYLLSHNINSPLFKLWAGQHWPWSLPPLTETPFIFWISLPPTSKPPDQNLASSHIWRRPSIFRMTEQYSPRHPLRYYPHPPTARQRPSLLFPFHLRFTAITCLFYTLKNLVSTRLPPRSHPHPPTAHQGLLLRFLFHLTISTVIICLSYTLKTLVCRSPVLT
jgi:hypothetical protein